MMCHSSNAELQNKLSPQRNLSLILGVFFLWLWFLCRVILAELQVILQIGARLGTEICSIGGLYCESYVLHHAVLWVSTVQSWALHYAVLG